MTKRALKNGLLVPMPCRVCENQHAHAHHADYERPLDVTFLCNRHYNRFHSLLNRRLQNSKDYSQQFHDQILAEFLATEQSCKTVAGNKNRPGRKHISRSRHSPRFMYRRELAEHLGVHIETVKRMEKDGRLPKPLKFGPKITLHDRAVIEDWVRGPKL